MLCYAIISNSLTRIVQNNGSKYNGANIIEISNITKIYIRKSLLRCVLIHILSNKNMSNKSNAYTKTRRKNL